MTMTFIQIVEPTPDIPCEPGWCLQYVRQAFGAPIVEPTATKAWENAQYRHEDMNFPEGVAVPIFFSLEREPAGHVALLMPDGSVYSTTSPTGTTPVHHLSLDDLMLAYQRYNPLTYLGWSEDISGVRVVEETSITVQAETIIEDDMFTDTDRQNLEKIVRTNETTQAMLDNVAGTLNGLVTAIDAGKPIDEETMLNARKLVERVIDGK